MGVYRGIQLLTYAKCVLVYCTGADCLSEAEQGQG